MFFLKKIKTNTVAIFRMKTIEFLLFHSFKTSLHKFFVVFYQFAIAYPRNDQRNPLPITQGKIKFWLIFNGCLNFGYVKIYDQI